MQGFDSPVGKGVLGVVDGRKLIVGNVRIMQDAGIDTSAMDAAADELRRDGATAIYVAIDGKAAGIFAIADPVKATTPEAIRALQADGIRVVMLTGDNLTTAKAVAQKLGISDVEAEVLPEDKGKIVEKLRNQRIGLWRVPIEARVSGPYEYRATTRKQAQAHPSAMSAKSHLRLDYGLRR